MIDCGIVTESRAALHRAARRIALLAAFAPWACISLPVEAAALVVDVQGGARPAGGSQLVMLTELPDGARVELEAGARVGLVDAESRRQFDLVGPGAFRVTAGRVEVTAGAGQLVEKRPLDAAFRDVRLRPARVTQASIPMRGEATGSSVQLLGPVSTWLLATPTSFSWREVRGAVGYRIQITDGTGKPLHETRIEGTTLATPVSIAFEPGRTYAWQVDAILSDGGTLEGWTEFGIADEARRARAEAARPAAGATFAERVLYAMLLDDTGLREAARGVWAALARERPEDDRLRRMAEDR